MYIVCMKDRLIFAVKYKWDKSQANNLSLPVGEKLTIRQGIFTGDNTFIYCIKYEYLLLI